MVESAAVPLAAPTEERHVCREEALEGSAVPRAAPAKHPHHVPAHLRADLCESRHRTLGASRPHFPRHDAKLLRRMSLGEREVPTRKVRQGEFLHTHKVVGRGGARGGEVPTRVLMSVSDGFLMPSVRLGRARGTREPHQPRPPCLTPAFRPPRRRPPHCRPPPS